MDGGVIGQILGEQIGSISSVLVQSACTSPLTKTQRQLASKFTAVTIPKNANVTVRIFSFFPQKKAKSPVKATWLIAEHPPFSLPPLPQGSDPD